MKVNIKVVIAEDEPAIIRSIKISITRFSPAFEIVGTAYNGQEGLELLRREKPDLVFTDIRMPVMTGLEMIEEAIKGNINTQFVILSGYSEFSYAKKAMEFGVKEYILKPIVPDEIQAVLVKAEQLYEVNRPSF